MSCKRCVGKLVSVRKPIPWELDPVALIAYTGFRVTPVLIQAGVVTQVAKPDPTRLAIGFMLGNVASNTFSVGPIKELSAGGIVLANGSTERWFTLQTHLTLVNQIWYAFDSLQRNVYVYEVYATPSGA